MLGGEDFGGRHEAGLGAVVDSQQHAHESHEGFAAADVALHEAVHLATGAHVLADLADDAFLRAGEGEWDLLLVEAVEEESDMGEDAPLGARDALLVGILVVELEEEELLKFETQASLVELLTGGGVVDGQHGFAAGDEAEVAEDVVGEVLRDGEGVGLADGLDESLGDARQSAGTEAVLLHLVGGVVDRHEGVAGAVVDGGEGLDIGMGDLPDIVEDGRLAHDEVFHIGFQSFAHPLGAGEPDELDVAGAVEEVDGEPLAAGPSGEGLHVGEDPFDDDEGIVLAEGGNGGDDGAVDISERQVVEHVGIGADA